MNWKAEVNSESFSFHAIFFGVDFIFCHKGMGLKFEYLQKCGYPFFADIQADG